MSPGNLLLVKCCSLSISISVVLSEFLLRISDTRLIWGDIPLIHCHLTIRGYHGQPATYAYGSLLSNPDDCVQERLIIGPEHPI